MTDALVRPVRRRMAFVLTRHGDRIKRIGVRVGDDNGSRGGADKFCRIQVRRLDAPVAVIEDVDVNLYTAIDSAAERAGRSSADGAPCQAAHFHSTHTLRR